MADSVPSRPALTVPLPTARLVLRAVQPDDDPMLTRIWTDPDVRRYMGGPLSSEVVRHRNGDFVGKPGKYCVTLRATLEPIGLLGIGRDHRSGHLEVSYGLLPEHWRRGYAQEAILALLAWAFERLPDADVIVANTRADNAPSRQLLQAIGAECVESFGEGDESVMYAMARRQFLTPP
ncbi:GNAT family N-acetyltransferase [Actinopolymorpha sp. B9G3]|uniref:GNAT family N-acetyltransferase n=1 Tax=Actinopolymorpha sp. B9G3 TaxID=3158970 RepID=UPI0032D9475A